jgi:Ca2+-binding EF-hand superfamily protein
MDMKKLLVIGGSLCLLGASMMASADDAAMKPDGMHDNCMAMHFKMMDKNNDGMVSKSEYMDAMAKDWEDMPKSKGDMVSMDDMKKHMQMMHDKCKDNMGSMNH